jgi:PST family polysaccharide transporter
MRAERGLGAARHMSLAERAGEGVAWTGAGKAVVQLVGVEVTLVLARWLTPADFGLVGMIAVVTGFLAVFGEMGFATALVQRETVQERHRSTVFWLNVATGVVLAAALALSAPMLAAFFREPRLTWLVRVLAVELLISPLAMVQHATLSRDMEFRTLAIAETASVLVSSVVALGLAFSGFGVWALVGKSLAENATESAAMWLLSSWRPRWRFEKKALGELWRFGGNLLGYSTISYWASQVDDLLIGRFLGASALGLYGRAYSTMMMPVSEVGSVLGRVMFPTFAKLQTDPAETKRLYLRVLALLAFVTFPVMFGIAVVADRFILVLFGPQWLGATTVLRVYCVVGASHAVGSTVTWIYKATGRTDWMLRWGVFAGSLTIGGIALGVALGTIEWVAVCYAIVTVGVLGYPRFSIPGRLIGLGVGEVFRAIRGALGCALLSAGLLWALGVLVPVRLSPVLDLGARAFIGAMVYTTCARVFAIRGLDELRVMVQRQLERMTGASERR